MITINQLTKFKKRPQKKQNVNIKRLDNCPQKAGVVQFVFEQTPRKPNSAKRKVAKVKLSNDKLVNAYLYGIGHTLTHHSVVLVRGGRCQDLIGVRYRPIRSSRWDFKAPPGRKTKPSKFGIKTAEQ